MKFSLQQDILAPIEFVFDRSSDFAGHERQALRRGIEIVRTDEFESVECGATWDAKFPYRGKRRQVAGELVRFEQPDGFALATSSGGLKAGFDIELVALAKSRTRMKIGLDLRPDTMKARLFVQSLKLAKARLDRRFRRRMGEFAAQIESEYGVTDPMARGL